jgi:ubiquinone/menaquinone biosynthesis C-methylase UbiE
MLNNDNFVGAMEDFVEESIVARTRVGKDDVFLDVGSGIGQVSLSSASSIDMR